MIIYLYFSDRTNMIDAMDLGYDIDVHKFLIPIKMQTTIPTAAGLPLVSSVSIYDIGLPLVSSVSIYDIGLPLVSSVRICDIVLPLVSSVSIYDIGLP